MFNQFEDFLFFLVKILNVRLSGVDAGSSTPLGLTNLVIQFLLYQFNFNKWVYNFLPFNLRLFKTTETELNAIAPPAIIGSNKKPLIG